MQAVARAVFAQIVDLGKAAARLWMIGTVLELAEIRQLRGFQRLRLDRDAARSRQLQRQADEPQRVIDPRPVDTEGLLARMARIDAQGEAERPCKGQPFGLLRAAHGVTDQQMQPAAADRQPGCR